MRGRSICTEQRIPDLKAWPQNRSIRLWESEKASFARFTDALHQVLTCTLDNRRLAPNAIQPPDQFVSAHPAQNNVAPLRVGGQAEQALYLNPPYDSEIGSMDNKRMEYLFLEHCFRWLVVDGVLLMVVPQEWLDAAIPLLAGNFTGLRVYRLTDPEAERFDQVALFGVRKRMRGEHYERNRTALLEMVWRREMTVFEVKEKGFKEMHKRERFTNELALVYEDGRTLVLGEEKKKEDCDAERPPAPGAPGVPAEQ
jgi:hypothetical protein